MTGSFTSHCGNTGMERTPNNSQHTNLTLEKKILPPLLPGFELATFRSRVQRQGFFANAQRKMYMSALHLKTILQTHSAPLSDVWPPYATDLTDKAAKILSHLFCSTQWHTSLDLQQNQSLMSMLTLKMKVWRRNWSQSAKILCSYHRGGGANTETCCTGNDGKVLDWLSQSD